MARWSPKEAGLAAWRAYCLNHARLRRPIEEQLRAGGVLRSHVPTPSGSLSLLHQAPLSRASSPVVLVHGSPASAARWQDYLLHGVLSQRHYVAVDRPGFGDSQGLGSVPNIYQQAVLIGEALARKRWLNDAVIIGHSLGGAVALALALAHPERVRGVVLVCAALDPDLEKVSPAQRWLASGWCRSLVPKVWRHSNDELINLAHHLTQLKAQLRGLRCPVSIVHSRDDGLVPFDNVDFLRAHLPKQHLASVIDAPSGGHFLPWTHRHLVEQGLQSVCRHAQTETVNDVDYA